jgi:lysyl-tRNA synthetase class 2
MFRDTLQNRALFTREIRRFFEETGFVEVETPVLSPFLIPEAAIEVFRTELFSLGSGPLGLYLAPSPELWMKRLISEGSGNIFQIARSFRNADLGSAVHSPEFRLLEWYSTGSTYLDCIRTTETLVERLFARALVRTAPPELSPPFRRMSMEEVFRGLAGIELAECRDVMDLVREGNRLGLVMPESPTWEEAFHVIFLSRVEPDLPMDKPLVLLDYPASIPTTARGKPGTPYAERWELYLKGVEIANCYSEETDPQKIRSFLRNEEERKRDCRVPHPTDGGFAALFDRGFPPCAGVALGVDRLEMVLRGESSLEGVILFPFSGIMHGQSATH